MWKQLKKLWLEEFRERTKGIPAIAKEVFILFTFLIWDSNFVLYYKDSALKQLTNINVRDSLGFCVFVF